MDKLAQATVSRNSLKQLTSLCAWLRTYKMFASELSML